MRLAWATDIHLDHCLPAARGAFQAAVRATGADALLLTGDLAEAGSLEATLLELAGGVGMPVYFVLGNHDFYGGAVAEVRARTRALRARDDRLRWLPAEGVVALGAGVTLIGHDGWADGRLGDWWGSTVVLNDYLHIRDLALARLDPRELLARMQVLAAEAAAHLGEHLRRALAVSERVLVATHVPPFRAACWYQGRICGDDWLPHLTSQVAGEALLAAVAAFPGRAVTVLCGHTHGEGTARVAPFLTVLTGGAEYGSPRVQRVLDTAAGDACWSPAPDPSRTVDLS